MEDLTVGVRSLGQNVPIDDGSSSGGGPGVSVSDRNAYALSPPLIEIQLINVTEEAVADRFYDEAAAVLATDAVTTRLLAGTDTFCDVDDENIQVVSGTDPCPFLGWLRPHKMTSLIVRIAESSAVPSVLYPGALRASFPCGLLPSISGGGPASAESIAGEAECDIEYALEVLQGLIEFVRSRRGRSKTFCPTGKTAGLPKADPFRPLQAIPRHIYRTLATEKASGRPLRRSSPITLQTVMIRPKTDQ